MTKSVNAEKLLLGYVIEDRLRTSLALIREATESVWARDDAVRIIHDFTDHGPQHSKRLICHAVKLLKANSGASLSPVETYLLLAGIYLHDIGMQCDVVRFPEVKACAEKLGARFDVEFVAASSSDYSINEQKAIRSNHHYLAAAWLDYAFRTGDTVLGLAARTIPEELVSDVMDICIYHAILPIQDCPITCRFDSNQRKQLMAALLRFADEIDISATRVSIETVKTFRLDAHNAVYWWLHSRTKIIFPSPNTFVLTIRLHNNDVEKYGPLIHDIFIQGFQTKNHSILSVLATSGLSFVLGAYSGVLTDDYAECLPDEIASALISMQRGGEPLINDSDKFKTMREFVEATNKIHLTPVEKYHQEIDVVLESWRSKLDVEYIAFLSGHGEKDTILTVQASAGLLPRTGIQIALPHFNWRKAGLCTDDGNSAGDHTHSWESISLTDREWISKGFRGETQPFSSCIGLIPIGRSGGPFGLLVIGNQRSITRMTDHNQYIVEVSRDLGMRLLLLHLSQIMRTERDLWEKSSMMTAHRIRSSAQLAITSLRVIEAERKQELGFTARDREISEANLEHTLRTMPELALRPLSRVGYLDTAIDEREFIPLGEIIWAAVADLQDSANEQGIDVQVSEGISRLPFVYANRSLMRYAFLILLDNTLTYSAVHPKTLKRLLRVETSEILPELREATVVVVRFGQGITDSDKDHVFDQDASHESRKGLWEVRRIVAGHGGHIDASSVHYANEPITNRNIGECVTTISIVLPVGEKPPF